MEPEVKNPLKVLEELKKARLHVLTEMQSACCAGDIKVLAEAWALLCHEPPQD